MKLADRVRDGRNLMAQPDGPPYNGEVLRLVIPVPNPGKTVTLVPAMRGRRIVVDVLDAPYSFGFHYERPEAP